MIVERCRTCQNWACNKGDGKLFTFTVDKPNALPCRSNSRPLWFYGIKKKNDGKLCYVRKKHEGYGMRTLGTEYCIDKYKQVLREANE